MADGSPRRPDDPISNWALGYTYSLMDRIADASRHAGWMQTHVPQLPYTAQLAPLRGSAEFDRIVAKAARRVQEFEA